jgi:3-isopropylmalate/(R)-2-methylmalate dehydratase small subunit
MSVDLERKRIVGRGVSLPGDDIDTDRIIPARFLRCVTFEGLEEHAFEDERKQSPDHPFNQDQFKGAGILVVGSNFGCGSSREHAPEALRRWGIQAIVGKSFAEIFIGNCTALGVPCLTLDGDDADWLLEAVASDPAQEVVLDIEKRQVQFGGRTLAATMLESQHSQLTTGTWNATMVLLEAGEEIDRVAESLPYVTGH